MVRCAAWKCRNMEGPEATAKGISFHKFRKDPNIRKAWTNALQMENFTPTNQSVICSEHFEKDCFDPTPEFMRRVLKKDAVPTIFEFPPHLQKKKSPSAIEAVTVKSEPETAPSKDNLQSPLPVLSVVRPVVLEKHGTSVLEKPHSSSLLQKASATAIGPAAVKSELGAEEDLHSQSQQPVQTTVRPALLILNQWAFQQGRSNPSTQVLQECIEDKDKSVESNSLAEVRDNSQSDKECEDSSDDDQHDCRDSKGSNTTTQHLSIDKDILQKWQQFGEAHGLSTDTDIARFLLRQFDNKEASNRQKLCVKCGAPLLLVCITCKQGTQEEHSYTSVPDVISDNSPAQDNVNDPEDNMQEDISTEGSVAEYGHTHKVQFSIQNQKLVPRVVLDRVDGSGKQKCLQEKAILPAREVSSSKLQRADTDSGKKAVTVTVDHLFSGDHNYFQNPNTAPSEDTKKKKQVRTVYHCTDCGEGFQSKVYLRAHTEIETDDKQYSCSVCQTVFSKLGCLKTHKLRNHKDMFVCRVCAESFPCKEDLATHKTQHQFRCTVCRQIFKTSSLLDTHLQEEHKRESYKCETCSIEFSCAKRLERHRRAHKPKAFPCDQCGHIFKSAWKKKMHMQKHTGIKHHLCQHCGRQFMFRYQLKDHVRDRHPAEVMPSELQAHSHKRNTRNKNFICDQCGKAFSCSSYLIQHMHVPHKNTGNRSKASSCRFCGQLFASVAKLHTHLRTHTGGRPYSCDQCSASFSTQGSLKIHELTHTNERPFVCSHCGKGFKAQAYLKMHARIHTGERPYKCKVCGAAFIQSSHLKRHEATHLQEKPFSCPDCDGRFMDTTNLKNHRISKHGAMPKDKSSAFQCHHCHKSFPNLSAVMLHNNMEHRQLKSDAGASQDPGESIPLVN